MAEYGWMPINTFLIVKDHGNTMPCSRDCNTWPEVPFEFQICMMVNNLTKHLLCYSCFFVGIGIEYW
jgi:hypothetical protein